MPDGGRNLPVPYRRPAEPRDVRVIAWAHPLRIERAEVNLPAGGTVVDILDATEFPEPLRKFAQVWICDGAMRGEPQWIPAPLWRLVRPKAGTVVTVRVVPGKKGGKGFLGILLSIISAGVGFLIPGIGGVIAGLVVKAVGSLLVKPPKAPKSNAGGGVAASPTYSVSGTRNQANPYQPVPRLYGRHRVTPPLGALPYTEIVGDDQYLRMVFCFGYGPLELEDLRIGETPLASFDDVEYEVRQGFAGDAALTLYTADVFELPLSVELRGDGGPQIQVSQAGADELSVDITFDRGLGNFGSGGGFDSLTLAFDVEYRLFGSVGAWTLASHLSFTGATRSLTRRGFRWTLPARGQYEVRLTRVTVDGDPNVAGPWLDHSIWSALRSLRQTPPINQTGLALVAVRIRASDQLNGVIDQFNAIATAMLPMWDAGSPGGWSAPVATRNPAWAYLDALRGNANKRPIADARIDLPAFAEWAEDCDALAQDGEAAFTFDGVFDFEGTLFDALKAISSAGRAGFAMVDGKFSIVQDKPQTVPIQHFTPRNSFGFKGSKPFPEAVHALKVQFVNEDAGWQKDEATVYADGYAEANATKFEALETFGITRYGQAWREGRYHQAVAKLRPESFEVSTDVEHIVCKRGDLIRVSHDAPLWGGGWGRIKARTQDASSPSSVIAVTLDERVNMEAGGSYVLRVRRDDGSSELHALTTVAGESATLLLATPVATGSAPEVADLAMFGASNLESIEAIVLKIEPEQDFGARITFCDAAPDIHLAYTGTIPAFDSQISQTSPIAQRLPARPIVEDVRSDEDVLLLMPDGSLLTRILVTLGAQSATAVATAAIETQFRRAETDGAWQRLALVPAGVGVNEITIIPVDDGAIYDVRLRAVSAVGTASDWTLIENHTVIGKTTPPPDVDNLRREGDWLRWSYLDRPRDFAGFFVRHRPGSSAEWDNALLLYDGILGPSEINITQLVGTGTRTVMVKAVDVAGNESATAASAILELGDPVVDNVVTLYNWSGAGFLDAIYNGSVVGGEAVADDIAGFWSGNDGAAFWLGGGSPADGELFWDASYAEMTYTAPFTPGVDEVGARLTLVTSVTAGLWEILYRTGAGSPPAAMFWSTDGALFWSGTDSAPFWSALVADNDGFVPWPGEVELTAQQYDIRIRTGAGLIQGIITTFQGIVDVPDESEFLDDVTIAAGGTRLPIVENYRSIRIVLLTLQDDGGVAAMAQVIDKSETLGPLIQCFDIAGVATSGQVDAQIQGVAA